MKSLLFLAVLCLPAIASADDDYRIELLGNIDSSQFPEVGVKFRILDKGIA
jgi:hypothetical protein